MTEGGTPPPLLSFEEVANELSVTPEKVRRLVVEERALQPVFVDETGARFTTEDLNVLLAGKDFLEPLMVDGDASGSNLCRVADDGALLFRVGAYLNSDDKIVGFKGYKASDLYLRVEQTELDRYRKLQASGSTAGASQPSLEPQRIVPQPSPLPRGLTPSELASAFAGIDGRDKANWHRFFSNGRSPWIKLPPVLLHAGGRGSGIDRKPITSLRDPVAIAKYLLKGGDQLWPDLNRAFQKKPELAPWRDRWNKELG